MGDTDNRNNHITNNYTNSDPYHIRKVEKFNGDKDSFSLWKIRMLAAIDEADLLWVIDPKNNPCPIVIDTIASQTDVIKINKMQHKVYSALISALGNKPLLQVQHLRTAQEIWNKLIADYEGKTLSDKCRLLRKIAYTPLLENQSVIEYLNEMEATIQELATMNFILDDELKAVFLLCSLPPSYHSLRTALEVSYSQKISYDKVKQALLQ